MRIEQADLEALMVSAGRDRAQELFAKAEDKGRASEAPYAQRLYREYVLPLEELLTLEIEDTTPGQRRAHAQLLADLNLGTVAFLAVRTAINSLMAPGETNHRVLGYSLGRTIHRELVLGQIADELPDLYHTLSRDFARRMSSDERHRMTVYQMQAKEAGIDFFQWGVGARDQVGLYLLGKLEDVGLLEIDPQMTAPGQRSGSIKSKYRPVSLSPAVLQSVDAVKTYVVETSPMYGPCVIPPRPWTSTTDGGFHTPELRRVHRNLVKLPPTSRALLRNHEMPLVLEAVNALQNTRWAVNTRVLDVLMTLAEAGREVAGVVLPTEEPRPPRAEWMDTTEKGAVLSDEQTAQMAEWKRAMVGWYERRKLRVNDFGRFYAATRQAQQFRDGYPLHFVYFLDSRGRVYPLAHGLNPQGNDLQKGLLHFADAHPIHHEDAERWFLIQGANKWGYDKATLDERVQWARDRKDAVLAMADNPYDNRDWTGADCPLQFLAWCFEYADWVRDPGFMSRLPISMDGSCNGLQHFSAMLRDPVGGEATNLTPGEFMQDIYNRVREAAEVRIAADRPEDPTYRDWWVGHGIKRDVVKRSVMTTPYGVTQRSATDYVISDYLVAHNGGLDRKQWRPTATYVMSHVWPAIGDVVVAARLAMNWLKAAAPKILAAKAAMNDPDPVISWTTPSGFLATQAYFEFDIHRIRSLLHGDVRIRVAMETDKPAVARHATALAPNFVHSMDAAHMTLVAARAAREGISSLAMIHDDYGTHAAHAQRLYHIIREEFVRMYQDHDPLQEFHERHEATTKPPKKGTLDITGVLQSKYFFS